MVVFVYHDDGFEPNKRPRKQARMSSSTRLGRNSKRPTASAPSDTPQSANKRRRYNAATPKSARKRCAPPSPNDSPQETPSSKRARVDVSDVEMSDSLPFFSASAYAERRRRREKLAKNTVRGAYMARTSRTTYAAPSMTSSPASTPCPSSATVHSDERSQPANVAASASFSQTAGSFERNGDAYDFEASQRVENTTVYTSRTHDCPESTGFLPDNGPPEVIDVSTGAYNEEPEGGPDTAPSNTDGIPAVKHWFLEDGRLLLNIIYNSERKVAVFVDVPPY